MDAGRCPQSREELPLPGGGTGSVRITPTGHIHWVTHLLPGSCSRTFPRLWEERGDGGERGERGRQHQKERGTHVLLCFKFLPCAEFTDSIQLPQEARNPVVISRTPLVHKHIQTA